MTAEKKTPKKFGKTTQNDATDALANATRRTAKSRSAANRTDALSTLDSEAKDRFLLDSET